MGYATLSADAKGVLQEIARMAYGTGFNEGRDGGSGRMGLLDGTTQGTFRVVKFNTHLGERWTGPSADADMWASSNKLRRLLLQLGSSAGLGQPDMNRIRAQLKLPLNQDTVNKLLDRRNVAKVVSIIGGNEVWNDALAGKNMADYQSAEHTRFADLTNQDYAQTTGVKNVKTIDETKDQTGIFTRFSMALLQQTTTGRRLPPRVQGALMHRLAGLDQLLREEGYLSSLTDRAVSTMLDRLIDKLVQLNEGGMSDDGLASFACSRMRAMLKFDKYVLATYGDEAYQNVKQLEKFGVSPDALDQQVTQLACKYGFNENERRMIFQTAARLMVQKLREQEPADVRGVADAMNEGLGGGVSVAVFAGMAACREGNEARRNEIIKRGGWLENWHVNGLLQYFDNLSGVGGFDSKDRWKAFGTYLLSFDSEDFYSKIDADGFFYDRTKEVESYRADAAAVEKLKAEIDEFCQDHGAAYKDILKVPERSFEACVGSSKPSSYCEPYARYRFELAKRIVGADWCNRYRDRHGGYELVPRKFTPGEIAKMLDGKFDEIPNVVDRESLKEFVFRAGLETLQDMSFQEKGPFGGNGESFNKAFDKLVSSYAKDRQDAVRGILLTVLERKLRANGPILGPDDLNAAVRTFFASSFGKGVADTDECVLAPIFSSTLAEDLVAIRDSGIDLLKVVKNWPKTADGNPTADAHLLALLIKPQKGGPTSFAGKEDELVQKIVAFEKYIRSEAMPSELRFLGKSAFRNEYSQHELHILAIVASAYPGLVDFVNAVSAGNVPDDAKTNFLAFVQPRMAKVLDVLSQLARLMVGNDASQEAFQKQFNTLKGDIVLFEDGVELMKTISDDRLLDGFQKKLTDKIAPFVTVQKDAEKLLGEMRKLGVLVADSVFSLLGRDPMDKFTSRGILRPSPPDDYSKKMIDLINVRRAALKKYEKIRNENNGETRESKAHAIAADLVLRMLSSVEVKYFTNEDGLQAFYDAFCTALTMKDGIFDQINACLEKMGAAANDQAKVDAMVGFFRRMVSYVKRDICSDLSLPFRAAVMDGPQDFLDTENDFLEVIMNSLLRVDSRLFSAFEDRQRTDITFYDKLKQPFDPGGGLNVYEQGELQSACSYQAGRMQDDFVLWEENGLTPGGGILDADDVKRLTRCGLTPKAIRTQIDPAVNRFDLTEDEKRTVIQTIFAILARRLRQLGHGAMDLKDVDESVLAQAKVGLRQELANMADGTGGPLVAALLLCKSGKSPAEIHTTIVNIATDKPSEDPNALYLRLADLSNKKGAKLMGYFNLLSGWITGGDNKSKFALFAKQVLSNNAAEIDEAGKAGYLEKRKMQLGL